MSEQTSERKLSPYTRLAIQQYDRMARMETRLDQATKDLQEAVRLIPEADMDYYMEQTEKIQQREDDKSDILERRRDKRNKWAQRAALLRRLT